jgi:predicted kinase
MHLPHKLFIQMSGAPGSGKTTMSNLLAQSLDGVVINHDLIKSFFLDIDFDFEQSGKLTYRFQLVLAEDMIKQGRSVIIDSTCNHSEGLEKGMALAEEYGYDYRYVECRVKDIDLLDQRLRSRAPMRSQRTGVSRPPTDAGGAHQNRDYHALFKRWIESPCRPAGNIIVVDSSSHLEERLEYILKQLVTPDAVQPVE